MADDSALEDRNSQLEVVLVNARSKAAPQKADALAQHNLDGGGNTDEKRQAQTPLPVLPEEKSEADVKLALRRVEKLEREARQLLTQKQATDVFWFLPDDGDRRNGIRSMALVQERDDNVHDEAKRRLDSLLDR